MGVPDTDRASERGRQDAGFTLIEAVVALFVLGIIFTALAAAAVGTLRASLVSRVEQQGIDFATEALETARAMDFAGLAMTSDDLAGDPHITACGPDKCIDPGLGSQEQLIVSSAGGVSPHIVQIPTTLANNVPISVATYVTDPGDAEADYKRVTVIASWNVGGVERSRAVSSLVAETTRGLPIPVFKLTPLGETSASVNARADAAFGFELSNQGAPDRWNLTISGAGTGEWELFADDGNRVWDDDPLIDVPLTNTNSPDDSIVDTDRIDPTASVVFWAVRSVGAAVTDGDYWSVLTATSAAQGAADGGAAEVDLLVRVVDGSVTGGAGSGDVDTTPGAPTNLQLTSGDGQLVAAWTAPASEGTSAITDYVISYKLSTGVTWTAFNDGVSAATAATLTGLTNNSTYDVSVAAKNSVGIGAQAATAQGMPEGAATYTAPVTCPASPAPPTLTAPKKFTMRAYALHNRSAANPSWPGPGVPAATSTIGQGLPLIAAVDGAQVPAGTDLPVYSSDISATEPGRIVNVGGSLTSASTTQVVDWRSTIAKKTYSGTAAIMFWVAPVTGDATGLPWSIVAQPYYSSGGMPTPLAPAVTASGSAGSFGAAGCQGWQQVWMSFPIDERLGNGQYIGVRVWTPGGAGMMTRLRVAYDVVGDFPATFTVPER